jgi:iron(II)-dependent oxidoreductase
VNARSPIGELAEIQSLLLALVEDADENTLREQYHPDLSPLGWHLGHCVFIECLWLQEKVLGAGKLARATRELYTPPHTPKSERGRLLPSKHELLDWARERQAFNLNALSSPRSEWRDHPLLADDYLIHFLVQHNCQHYETMLMVLTQRALARFRPQSTGGQTLQPRPPGKHSVDIPAGHYRVGGEHPTAYDNEVPRQRAELLPFTISKHPVSNAEYLAFMQDGGYRRKQLWSNAGWEWCRHHDVRHPDHWRQNEEGHWCGIGVRGTYQLADGEPVCGISHYEASAFARWAGGSLPHEYEWETACRLGVLQQTGRVWEWCDNTFHPYQGFTAFPYPEYSQPWFDGRHYSLRGGSLHTRASVKRPSFRNFFEADKRHIFAGLRLSYRNR